MPNFKNKIFLFLIKHIKIYRDKCFPKYQSSDSYIIFSIHTHSLPDLLPNLPKHLSECLHVILLFFSSSNTSVYSDTCAFIQAAQLVVTTPHSCFQGQPSAPSCLMVPRVPEAETWTDSVQLACTIPVIDADHTPKWSNERKLWDFIFITVTSVAAGRVLFTLWVLVAMLLLCGKTVAIINIKLTQQRRGKELYETVS